MIGDQFLDIIRTRASEMPIQKIADVFVDETETNTERGIQPDGTTFPPYSPKTKKSGRVNLRDKSRSVETVDTLYSQANEATIGFKGNAGYGASSKPSSEVFYYHQYGEGRNPERRVFPEGQDITSSEVQAAIERVEIILKEHFNE